MELDQLVPHIDACLGWFILQCRQVARTEVPIRMLRVRQCLAQLELPPRVLLEVALEFRVYGADLALLAVGVEQGRNEELCEPGEGGQ